MTGDASGLRPPSDREFAQLAAFVEREAGLHLAPAKKPLLASRLLGRLRELALPTYGAYHRLVEQDADERVRMIDALCTNETHFFREPHHFDFLARAVYPQLVEGARRGGRDRRLRVWSAGCSTGEEPYSVAISAVAALPEGWQVEVLASDLSTRALARAEDAVYPAERLAEVPAHLRRRFFLRGVGPQAGRIRVAPEGRAPVRFARLNLADAAWDVPADRDLILCRNVLIYFRPELRARVIERLVAHLRPGGWLLLGHAESLPSSALPLRTRQPTVYQKVAP